MKIGIVGAGQVGATAAYSMMMRRVGSGILLVDRNADLAVAQARDILDATPFADPVRVRAGEFADLDGARLVVLAAGTNQRPGESRLDLLSPTPKSSQRSCRRCWRRRGPDPSGGDQSRRRDDPDCHGNRGAARYCAGTHNRVGHHPQLREVPTLLAAHLGISPTYIDARVLGEHGDSEVLHWSGAADGNLSVAKVARQMGRRLTHPDRSQGYRI